MKDHLSKLIDARKKVSYKNKPRDAYRFICTLDDTKEDMTATLAARNGQIRLVRHDDRGKVRMKVWRVVQ